MKGGVRLGAGRPPATDPATKLVTVKLTPRQHAQFLDLGGSRWLKRMLETVAANTAPTSKSTSDK